MKSWVRKLRGVIGTGMLWAVPAAIVGAVGGLAGAIFGAAPVVASVLTAGAAGSAIGFVLGASFGTVLAIADRRRTLDQLTVRRAAARGALAGVALPVLLSAVAVMSGGPLADLSIVLPAMLAGSVSYGLLSAGLAAGTVALAKRTPTGAAELPTGDLERLPGAR